MAEEDTRGFLGRWSRRKTDAAQGKPLTEPAPPVAPRVAAVPVQPSPTAPSAAMPPAAMPSAAAPAPADESASAPVHVPTLEDVQLLTHDSDFKPFMAGTVSAEVRNAAMKKLFADPHFNIMDGLDIYIDDYSKPDPIPQAMLRQMNSAKVFNLFADDKSDEAGKDPAAPAPGESANAAADQSVAQSYADSDISRVKPTYPDHPSQPEPSHGSGASQDNHADTDLRLQPDHAAPAPDAGRGTQ